MARWYRSIFALPFACLSMLLALSFAGPSPTADYFGPVSVTAAADWNLPDIYIGVADVERHAIAVERSHITGPADGHRVAYTIANRPLSPWRIAADAYRHIDPGRMAI